MKINKIKQWLQLFNQAEQIFNSEASWETKYDLIFSEEICVAMRRILPNPSSYYSPDTSYQEDVTAWYDAMVLVRARKAIRKWMRE